MTHPGKAAATVCVALWAAACGGSEPPVASSGPAADAEPPREEVLAAMLWNWVDGDEPPLAETAELLDLDSARAGTELAKIVETNRDVRAKVLHALTFELGAPALEPIYHATDDADRKLEIMTLIRVPPPVPMMLLVKGKVGIADPRGADMCADFYESSHTDREMGLWCLQEFGDPRARDGLFKIAQEPFSPERSVVTDAAIRAIGNVAPEGADVFLVGLLRKGLGRPSTVLRALGQVGGPHHGQLVEPLTRCDDITAGGACDREVALQTLGQLRWPGALKLLTGAARRPPNAKTPLQGPSRSIMEEIALRDRLAAIEGLSFLGDPSCAPTLVEIMEDQNDDPQLRLWAARALGQVADESSAAALVTKIGPTVADTHTKLAYLWALWYGPSPAAEDPLFQLLEAAATPLLFAAARALAQLGEQVDQGRLRALLDGPSSPQLEAAAFAALWAGDDDTVSRLVATMERNQGLTDALRDLHSGPEGFSIISPAAFESGRIYRRLRNAQLLLAEDESHRWAHEFIIEQLSRDFSSLPEGTTRTQMLRRLAEDVRSHPDPRWRPLAAETLLALGCRGYVLMLAAESGPGAPVARAALDQHPAPPPAPTD